MLAEEEFDLTDFYERTGHQFADLVQHCDWQSHLCNDSSWSVDYTHYGKCYTFNRLGDHSLIKAGAGKRICVTFILSLV